MHLTPPIIFTVAAVVGLISSVWIVFAKAEQQPWRSLVPIYNLVVLCKIANVSPWNVLGFLIPILNLYFIAKVYAGVSKSFGGGTVMTVGLVLLPIIFFPILAFGDYEYISPFQPEPIKPRKNMAA